MGVWLSTETTGCVGKIKYVSLKFNFSHELLALVEWTMLS